MGNFSREWGQKAENIAYEYLLKEGYIIKERNWRLGSTIEVDLIIQHARTLIFVEVKARQYLDEALAAIDTKKRRKIIKAADIYLRHQEEDFEYRFDILVIRGTPEKYVIEHYPNAFIPLVNGRC